MKIHNPACITVAIAVSLFASELTAETIPAGVQFREFTIPNEPYEPSRIAGRLREIDQGCPTRSLSPQMPEYAYIGSLGSRLPLQEDVVLQLMAMADIMDSQMEHMPGMSRDKLSAWGSPAANVLITAGSGVQPVIEAHLDEWKGKPQFQVLVSVLREIQTQSAVQERASNRPKKRPPPGHAGEPPPPQVSESQEPQRQPSQPPTRPKEGGGIHKVWLGSGMILIAAFAWLYRRLATRR